MGLVPWGWDTGLQARPWSDVPAVELRISSHLLEKLTLGNPQYPRTKSWCSAEHRSFISFFSSSILFAILH